MAVKTHETAQIADLAREDGWAPIRRELDVRAFGINAWTAKEADEQVIGDHDEKPSGHEELYIVTSGSATFKVEGEEIDAPAGTIVFVRDPDAARGAVAREAGTTILSVGAKPGEAYRPRAWETNRDVIPMFGRGEHAEIKRILNDALPRYEDPEDQGTLYYNLACAEAQLGETDAAFEHLRAGLGGRSSLAEFAREDEDLAPLRDDPRFEELLASKS